MQNASRIVLAFVKTKPLEYLVIFITEEKNTEKGNLETKLAAL